MPETGFSSPLAVVAIVLVAAVLCGDLLERLRTPWITGCILAGILLAPGVSGYLTPAKVSALNGFLQASLALIAFNIGSKLTRAKLRTLGESTGLLALAVGLPPPVRRPPGRCHLRQAPGSAWR